MTLSHIPADKRIAKARAQLLMREPFFGCIAVHLEPVESSGVATFGTDGDRLYYNPDYVAKLDNEELQGVIAHEVMHVALNHHTRRGFRDPTQWNRAGDFAINPELLARGFKLPGEPELNPEFEGLATETIYAWLEAENDPSRPDSPPDQSSGAGPGSSQGGSCQPGSTPGSSDPGTAPPDRGCGEVRDAAPAHDKAALKAAEAKTQSTVRQARMMARRQEGGSLSDDLERLIEEMVAPQIDWREILRSFIDDRRQTDFSWLRPNRRLVPQGIYIPGEVPDGVSHVVLAVDTSGSIDQEILTAFASEIRSAFEDGSIETLTVVYADTEVKAHATFQAGDDITIEPVGGGGTGFSDTFRWVEDEAPDAVAVIYFTDLICSDFGEDPACPTLWAVWGDERRFDTLAAKAPFGEAVYLSSN